MTSFNSNVSELEKAILKVIAFFDIFDYPVTAREIWTFLEIERFSLKELYEFLDTGLKGLVSEKDGFYFCSGREELVDVRQQRFNFACKKIRKAGRMARLFQFVPGVRMVAVSNIIGSYNLRKDSDIDLLIITTPNRVWLGRLFCVLIAMILGVRPKPEKEKDKICLNFFLSEEAYDLADLRIEKDDVYLTFWMAGLFPVYNANYTYERFISANNWLREKLPNWRLKLREERDHRITRPFSERKIISSFLDRMEKIAQRIQLKKLPRNLKELSQQEGTQVVVNSRMIKLHSKDRRKEYNNKFRENFKKTLNLLR